MVVFVFILDKNCVNKIIITNFLNIQAHIRLNIYSRRVTTHLALNLRLQLVLKILPLAQPLETFFLLVCFFPRLS